MSHSGNNASRRLNGLQKTQVHNDREPFYNPSVFRYKCFGYLHLDSEIKGSAGECRGYQTRLERVANMVPDTREGAIKKFLEASADLGTYVDSEEDGSDQKVKEIYTARTMIYKEEDKWEDDHKKTRLIQPARSSPFPDHDLIDRTEWSCWGSTSVHFLVLDPVPKMSKLSKRGLPASVPSDGLLDNRKTKDDNMLEVLTQQLRNIEKHFDKNFSNSKPDNGQKRREMVKGDPRIPRDPKASAITPENVGLSIRKIDSSVGHFTVSDLGSIRICVETAASLTGTSPKRNPLQSGNNGNSQDQPPTGDATEDRKTALDLKKFYDFTLKVGHQMEYNLKEIREAVRDDFPGRTYRFGTLVVSRLQKTSEQTFTYMGKIINTWWKSM